MKDLFNNIYSKKWLRIILGILVCAILLAVFIVIVVTGAHENKIVYVDGRITNLEARFFLILSFVITLIVLFFGFFFESEDYDDGWKPFARYVIPAFAAFGLAFGGSFISELDSTYYLASGMLVGTSLLQIYQTIQRNKEDANDNPFIFKLVIPVGILVVSIALFGFIFAGLPILIDKSNVTLIESFHTTAIIVSSLLAVVAIGFVVHYTFYGFLSTLLFYAIIAAAILGVVGVLVLLMVFIPNQIGFIIASIIALLLVYVSIYFYYEKYPIFELIKFANLVATIIGLGVGAASIAAGKGTIVTQFGIVTFVFTGVSFLYTKLLLTDFCLNGSMILRCIVPGVLVIGSCIFAFTRNDIESGMALAYTIGGIGAGGGVVAIILDIMFFHNDLIETAGSGSNSGKTGINTKYSENDIWFMCCNTGGGYSDYSARFSDVKVEGKDEYKGYYQTFKIKVKISSYRFRNRNLGKHEGEATRAGNELMNNLWNKLSSIEMGSFTVDPSSLEIR